MQHDVEGVEGSPCATRISRGRGPAVPMAPRIFNRCSEIERLEQSEVLGDALPSKDRTGLFIGALHSEVPMLSRRGSTASDMRLWYFVTAGCCDRTPVAAGKTACGTARHPAVEQLSKA